MEKNMDNPAPEQPTRKKPSAGFLSRAAGMLAYPAAAISGYFTLDTATRSSFYGNFAKRRAFEDLQKPLTAEMTELIEKRAADKTVDVAEETVKIQNRYRYAVEERISNMGYKGFGDLWKCLHKNQKIKVGTEAMTVSGITFGALILLSENLGRRSGEKSADDSSNITR